MNENLFKQIQQWSEWRGMVKEALKHIDQALAGFHEENQRQWLAIEDLRKTSIVKDEIEKLNERVIQLENREQAETEKALTRMGRNKVLFLIGAALFGFLGTIIKPIYQGGFSRIFKELLQRFCE